MYRHRQVCCIVICWNIIHSVWCYIIHMGKLLKITRLEKYWLESTFMVVKQSLFLVIHGQKCLQNRKGATICRIICVIKYISDKFLYKLEVIFHKNMVQIHSFSKKISSSLNTFRIVIDIYCSNHILLLTYNSNSRFSIMSLTI